MTDPKLAHDIDAEISDHIERRVRDLRNAGLTETDARGQAHAEFGDLRAARRDLLRIDRRIESRHRTLAMVHGVMHDVRLAIRRLVAQRQVSALMIGILALAIGAATAVFSVVDQTMLRPAPFLHGDRLVDVLDLSGPQGGGGNNLSPPKILGWQSQPELFERFESYASRQVDLTGGGEPERVFAQVVSLGLFDMLGIQPRVGRGFAPGDGAPGSPKVAIIGDLLWRVRFGGDPSVLGSQLLLNDEPYTIVGVMHPETSLMDESDPIWLPFHLEAWGTSSQGLGFYGIGRLNPAVTPQDAQAVADRIAGELQKATPLPRSWYLGIERKSAAYVYSSMRPTLYILLGAVSLLLLIACLNVTNLFAGEVVARQRELQLRAAIGASRWRLVREVLVEGLLLAAASGVAATLLAYGFLNAVLAAAPERIAFRTTAPIEIDPRVLVVMSAATLIAGLGVGLVPALRSSRVDLAQSLRPGVKGSARGTSFQSGPGLLVVVEVALAMVLLVGATLLSRTLVNLHALEPGFDVAKLLTMHVALPSDRYPTETARRAFFDSLDEALRRRPDIEATAHAYGIPPEFGGFGFGELESEGGVKGAEVEVPFNYVSPAYFSTTGTRIIAGRAFNPDDRPGTIIVSEGLAKRYWPGHAAVGKRLRMDAGGDWWTVIGVAAVVEGRVGGRERTDLAIYHPFTPPSASATTAVRGDTAPRPPRSYAYRTLIVRAPNPEAVISVVRAQIWQIDPKQTIEDVELGTQAYAEPFARQQFLLRLMGGFAVTALILVAAGIFGVLSQAVTRRRREIGIRVALGATSLDVTRMIVRGGVLLALLGAAAGTAASLAGARVLESMLFGVSPHDAASYAVVVAVLLLVALVACWWPTRRALALEPAEVLRSE